MRQFGRLQREILRDSSSLTIFCIDLPLLPEVAVNLYPFGLAIRLSL